MTEQEHYDMGTVETVEHEDAAAMQQGDAVEFVPGEDGEFANDANTDLDVDSAETSEADDEVEEVPTADEKAKETKAAPKKENKRGDLPEGFVTPVGLAKEITKRGLYVTREGAVGELKPQMVYSYIKNAPKDNPFPGKEVEDSTGTKRFVCDLEEGVAWWEAKNARAKERKENAAQKISDAAKKAAKAQEAKATTDEAEDADEAAPVEEAE